jgi:hypothetical protein
MEPAVTGPTSDREDLAEKASEFLLGVLERMGISADIDIKDERLPQQGRETAMVKHANVAVIVAVIVASGLASCDAAKPRLASTTQNECTECKDPEDDTKSYYVSIGVMPSPYPIDWTSPNTMYGTTLLTSALGVPYAFKGDPLHSVGHAMLKVQCGDGVEHYISQTGAV